MCGAGVSRAGDLRCDAALISGPQGRRAELPVFGTRLTTTNPCRSPRHGAEARSASIRAHHKLKIFRERIKRRVR